MYAQYASQECTNIKSNHHDFFEEFSAVSPLLLLFTHHLLGHPTHTRDAMAELQFFVISPPSGEISTAFQVDLYEHREWLHQQ